MTPGEAAYRWVSGGKTLSSERRLGMAGRMAEIQKAAGTQAAAARAAGVDRRTWQRWAAGTQKPKPATLARLGPAVRRARLSPGREQRLRSGQGTLKISGDMRVSSTVKHRDIELAGEDINPDALNGLVDAFLAGAGEDQLGEHLDDVMQDYFGGIHVEDVDRLSW